VMSPALQRPHVLIVSDDLELATFLGEGLVYAGFWTSAIASAVQALEVFRLRSFDVMLLDATLGGIGALELIRRLRGRSDRATSTERTDIPILVIAASSSELDPDVAERAGADGVILAPIGHYIPTESGPTTPRWVLLRHARVLRKTTDRGTVMLHGYRPSRNLLATSFVLDHGRPSLPAQILPSALPE
jgi:CheY-like chemotaxis protein